MTEILKGGGAGFFRREARAAHAPAGLRVARLLLARDGASGLRLTSKFHRYSSILIPYNPM